MNEMDSNSARTAMTRKCMSRPMSLLYNAGIKPSLYTRDYWLDYGSDKGFDADYLGIGKYDKYHYPSFLKPNYYSVITCIYVLNVVSPEIEVSILREIMTCLTPIGLAYVSVRRDLPLEGTKTQRFVTLPFNCVYEDRGFAMYQVPKNKLEEYIDSKV